MTIVVRDRALEVKTDDRFATLLEKESSWEYIAIGEQYEEGIV